MYSSHLDNFLLKILPTTDWSGSIIIRSENRRTSDKEMKQLLFCDLCSCTTSQTVLYISKELCLRQICVSERNMQTTGYISSLLSPIVILWSCRSFVVFMRLCFMLPGLHTKSVAHHRSGQSCCTDVMLCRQTMWKSGVTAMCSLAAVLSRQSSFAQLHYD